MIQAKHVMNLSTPVLSFDATVAEAIEFMRKNSAGFVAVRASDERFQGVLTEGGLVRVYLRYQLQADKEALILYRDLLEPMQLIHEEEVFPEVVRKLLTAVGHRIFVINNGGQVVGYVTAKDVLPYFTAAPRGKPTDQNESLKSDLYMYESFFDKSPFMMHSVNKDGVIQMANEMLHSVLEFPYGELIGKTIFDLYPKEAHKYAEEGLKTILSQGYHKVVRSQMLTKTGKSVEVELVSRVLTNQFQDPIGTMTVARPIEMAVLLKTLQLSE
ncbi:MAG: CBS domain-containing protein [Bdellovibrio sp.]|jgi:PAS domain S-box-containing protein